MRGLLGLAGFPPAQGRPLIDGAGRVQMRGPPIKEFSASELNGNVARIPNRAANGHGLSNNSDGPSITGPTQRAKHRQGGHRNSLFAKFLAPRPFRKADSETRDAISPPKSRSW